MKICTQHASIAAWVFAVMLLIQGTLEGSYFVAIWALMLGMVAAVCTCAAVVIHSRRRIVEVLESEDHAVDRFAGSVLSALDDQGRRRS